MKTGARVATSATTGLIIVGLLLFVPAGTLDYWQAWVFVGVFTAATIFPSLYLARTNPAALERRLQSGPTAEVRTIQKILIAIVLADLIATVVLSVFDHRMGWSSVPAWLCLLGDVLVAAGIGIAMLVIVQNNYAAATIRVESGQTLASGGVYKFVRHPMYVGNIVMMIGMPLALGSYWGLLFLIPGLAVLVLRILDEERLLADELAGYRDYTQQVRYRLAPYVW